MYLITQAVSWFLIQVSSKRLHLLKDKNMASKGNKQLQKAIALKEKKKKKNKYCVDFFLASLESKTYHWKAGSRKCLLVPESLFYSVFQKAILGFLCDFKASPRR